MQRRTELHTRLTALCPGLPRWASTRKVKTIWILLKQETVSGSGVSWAICKSAPRSRQITTPAPHHSRFLQAGCPSCRPTNSVKALKGQLRTELCVINVCKCSNTLGWLINNNWNELEITERSMWTHFKGLMTKLLLTTFFTTFWRHFEKNVKSNVFWNLWIFWKNVKYVFSNTVVVLLRCVASRPATGRWLPLAFILFFQVVPFLASRSPNSNFPANCCK